MDFTKDFTPLAMRTESAMAPIAISPVVFDNVVSAAIAVGELADMIKKNAAYNKPVNMATWANSIRSALASLEVLSLGTVVTNLEQLPKADVPMDLNTRLFHGIFGVFTEATELMEALQKARRTGEWDYTNIKEESGDFFWYSSLVLNEIDVDMDDVLTTVINKLKARYPDKYSDEAAINRDLAAERKILEA